MAQASDLMLAIFVESTVASQTAASALLFSQVIDHGIGVAVQPEEMVSAALSVLTDLTQVLLGAFLINKKLHTKPNIILCYNKQYFAKLRNQDLQIRQRTNGFQIS